MTRVATLLDRFCEEFRAGQSPNPQRYLSQVEGGERRQLEAAIDRFLTSEPRRPVRDSASAVGAAPARIAEDLERAFTRQAGLWPSLLPRLRARQRLHRTELVEQLTAALAAPDQVEKVGAYYHEMEQGTLPAGGVSDRVLQALARIVGESAARLREAGEAFDPMPAQRDPSHGMAFARTAPARSHSPSRAPAAGDAAAKEPEWDDIDRLFRGG